MSERAFGPSADTRWGIVRKVLPAWIDRLSAGTLVGLGTVGDRCGRPPLVWRRAEPSRDGLKRLLEGVHPSGATPLNAVLTRAHELFDPTRAGRRTLVLLSDGGNTCPPATDTCEIARQLHRDHGIRIEVVAFVIDPALAAAFTCVAQVTGGRFVTPDGLEGWLDFEVSLPDPWPLIVFAAGVAAALATSILVYRQIHRAYGRSPRTASAISGAFLGTSITVMALHLLLNLQTLAALFGALVVIAAAFAVRRHVSTRGVLGMATAAMAVLLAAPDHALAQGPTSAQECGSDRAGPAHHHVVAIDISGSVYAAAPRNLSLIREAATRYLCRNARPGETISLITFGGDLRGSAQEVTTISVPASGQRGTVSAALDRIVLPNPAQTRTYFREIAAFLEGRLRTVRDIPSILIFSDGVSDDAANPAEPSFGAFGTLYSVHGTTNVKVAFRGPRDLDPASLFNTPLQPSRPTRNVAIHPCLIDPQLSVHWPSRVILVPPWWNPLATTLQGRFQAAFEQECVDRTRQFALRLVHSSGAVDLARFERTVGPVRQDADVPLALARSAGNDLQQVKLVLVAHPGSSFEQILVPGAGGATMILQGWLEAHALLAAAMAGGTLLAPVAGIFLVHGLVRRRRRRPLIVTTLSGATVQLMRNVPTSLGGEGSAIRLPGMRLVRTLATAVWDGNRRNVLSLSARPGVQIAIDGVPAGDSASYTLGRRLRLETTDDDQSFETILSSGSTRDLGRDLGGVARPTAPARAAGSPVLVSSRRSGLRI